MQNPTEIIAVVAASPTRRALALASLTGLGAICLWIALTAPEAGSAWRIVLLGFAAVSFWMAERLRRATARRIELTAEVLRDDEGRVLAPLDQVAAVERGVFALKPSSGFLLRLEAGAPASWAPGLWWRLGRRLGVGGVASGHQARYMADAISALLAERHGRSS